MTPDQRLLFIGGYIFSGLYFSGSVAGGIAFYSPFAVLMALAGLGACTLSYGLQALGVNRALAAHAVNVSWALGVGAWVALLAEAIR